MKEKEKIIIDGSHGEGGGQIVRTAIAMSCALKIPVEIINIRKGREKSGLKNQHLACIELASELYETEVRNAEKESETLFFYAKKLKSKNAKIDIKTAGSITLVLQSIILPLILEKKKFVIEIIGGTDVPWSMPIAYFKNVFLESIKKYAKIDVEVIKRGYYPRGGGIVKISLKGNGIKDELILENKRKLLKIKGVVNASNDLVDLGIVEREINAIKSKLKKLAPTLIIGNYKKTECPGNSITLWARFSENQEDSVKEIIGADIIAKKGKINPEIFGEEVCETLIKRINSEYPIDENLGDNLIPFLKIFGGRIKTKITKHLESNVYVVNMFKGKKLEVKDGIVESND